MELLNSLSSYMTETPRVQHQLHNFDFFIPVKHLLSIHTRHVINDLPGDRVLTINFKIQFGNLSARITHSLQQKTLQHKPHTRGHSQRVSHTKACKACDNLLCDSNLFWFQQMSKQSQYIDNHNDHGESETLLDIPLMCWHSISHQYLTV